MMLILFVADIDHGLERLGMKAIARDDRCACAAAAAFSSAFACARGCWPEMGGAIAAHSAKSSHHVSAAWCVRWHERGWAACVNAAVAGTS